MTDDRTEIGKLVDEYAQCLKDAYANLMDMETEITPSEASSMACTALISARDTLFPKYSSSNRGHGGGSSGHSIAEQEKMHPTKRRYTGGKWDDPATVGEGGQMPRLRIYKRMVMEKFVADPQFRTHPEKAKEACEGFFGISFTAMFGIPLPEDWAKDGSGLTKGHASFLMDLPEWEFPELMDKKGAK